MSQLIIARGVTETYSAETTFHNAKNWKIVVPCYKISWLENKMFYVAGYSLKTLSSVFLNSSNYTVIL